MTPLDKTYERDVLKAARVTNYLSKFLYRFGLYDKELSMLETSKVILEHAALRKTKEYAAHLNNVAALHEAGGKYDEALAYWNDSLKIQRELGDRAG